MLPLGHVADASHQLIRVEGLGDVVIHAGEIALGAIRGHALGGEKDHRGAAETFIGPQLVEQSVAIQPRHHHVTDDHIRQHLLGFGEPVLAINSRGDVEALVFEVGLHGRTQTRFIVHQQQTHRRLIGLGCGHGQTSSWRNLGASGCWQPQHFLGFNQLGGITELSGLLSQAFRFLAGQGGVTGRPPHQMILAG